MSFRIETVIAVKKLKMGDWYSWKKKYIVELVCFYYLLYSSSGGYDSGSGCSIKIDQEEYAKNRRGLNIVVYNLLTQTVIDSICFDTYLAEMPAIRWSNNLSE